MKRKQSSIVRRDYTLLTFVLVFTSFFLFFAIRPSVSLIVTLNKERSEYTRINELLDKKIQDIITAQNNYIALAPFINQINLAIPNRQVISDTKELISTGTPEMLSFSIEDSTLIPIPSAQLSTIAINVSVGGTYSILKDYMTSIRSKPRIITLESLEINRGESTTSGELNSTMLLQTYFYHVP